MNYGLQNDGLRDFRIQRFNRFKRFLYIKIQGFRDVMIFEFQELKI